MQGDCDLAALQQHLAACDGAHLVMDGWTPLHFVAENRSVDHKTRAAAIALLLQFGADAHAIDEVSYARYRTKTP